MKRYFIRLNVRPKPSGRGPFRARRLGLIGALHRSWKDPRFPGNSEAIASREAVGAAGADDGGVENRRARLGRSCFCRED